MPDIVLYTLVSLDGATEDPHRYFPETGDTPGAPVFDNDLKRHETEMIASVALPPQPLIELQATPPRPGTPIGRSI